MDMKEIANKIFDQIIGRVYNVLNANNNRSVEMPHIDEKFKKLKMKGGIQATEGTLGDLSTLRRSGDVDVSLQWNRGSAQWIIKLSLSLGVLEIIFQQCRVWLGPMKSRGRLTVNVNSNTVDVQVSVKVIGSKSNLDFVRVVELKDITYVFTKAGKKLAPLKDITNHYVDKDVKEVIERELYKCLKEQISIEYLRKMLDLPVYDKPNDV